MLRRWSTRSRSSKSKSSKGHRQSWHVGHHQEEDHHHHPNNGPCKKGGKKRHRATWHFPRISRHSMHSFKSHHTRHEEQPSEAVASNNNHKYDAQLLLTQERKTFSYATTPSVSTSTGGTATRAPSPPLLEPTDTAPTTVPNNNRRRSSSKRKDGLFRKIKRRLRAIEDFLFPGCHPPAAASPPHPRQSQRLRGGEVLLKSCTTVPEHHALVLRTVELAKTLHGEEGLRAAGFEYRFIPCPRCSDNKIPAVSKTEEGGEASRQVDEGCEEPATEEENSLNGTSETNETPDLHDEDDAVDQTNHEECVDSTMNGPQREDETICHACAHQLFHIDSNTRVDSHSRKHFIADGDMYDAVASLAQETAQEAMQRDLGMAWVTLCPPPNNDDCCYPYIRNPHEPVRALVNAKHLSQRPTLLILTGKGKVRAGIFSRQHSLVAGMEVGTAMPLIREANLRQLNVVVLDPNVHGDALGCTTTCKSMAKLFHKWEKKGGTVTAKKEENGSECAHQRNQCCRDLYILSHSASGAHLARYLLDKSEFYLPHIRAIAFTDATHNVEWARKRGNEPLVSLLESDACIYFRCSTSDDNKQAGEDAPTDKFWKHRFGNVRTCWAGTKEHSLTNWFAHTHIWQHFDKFLALENDDKARSAEAD